MRTVKSVVYRITTSLEGISGVALVFMMTITTVDVILRAWRKPILGAYELISFACGVVVAFAIPITSWLRGHIFVDVVYQKLPVRPRRAWLVVLRVVNMTVFLLLGWYLMKLGADFRANGEVCPTLRIPLYPVAWGMACACWCQSLVMIDSIRKIIKRGTDHE